MPEQLSVSEFLEFTQDDVDNPSQTAFTSKLGLCRGTISVLEEVKMFILMLLVFDLSVFVVWGIYKLSNPVDCFFFSLYRFCV